MSDSFRLQNSLQQDALSSLLSDAARRVEYAVTKVQDNQME